MYFCDIYILLGLRRFLLVVGTGQVVCVIKSKMHYNVNAVNRHESILLTDNWILIGAAD